MSTEGQNPRELLAKMEAEEKAARERADKLAADNAKKKEELLKKLRDEDLADVRAKCKLHGFAISELKDVLKKRANSGMARKTTRKRREQVPDQQESPKS